MERQATGTTPYRYILNARIERAKIILATRTLSIAQVALAVGFSSQSHFSAAFRKHTGMSPRRFERKAPRVSDSTGVRFGSVADILALRSERQIIIGEQTSMLSTALLGSYAVSRPGPLERKFLFYAKRSAR
jgi:AraC-like DNA-binding protein